MDLVYESTNTEHRTVSDLTNLRYLVELTTSPSVVWIDLPDLDLTPGAPALALDPHDDALVGDVTRALRPLDAAPF
jgi:choloylglycine hydrolase